MEAIVRIIILLFISEVFSKPAYIETENECDNEDEEKPPNMGAPIMLSPNAQKGLAGYHSIYFSPDLEDIVDQQNYNVYHEEVHGTILMPRIKFGLDNEDDCLKDEQDYNDYANIVGGIRTEYSPERRAQVLKRPGSWRPVNRQERYPASEVDKNAPVRVYPNPNYNPTIEEMIPYAKVRNTPDTFIVMADDPVLVVDSVPNCYNESKGSNRPIEPLPENIVGFSGLSTDDLGNDNSTNSTNSNLTKSNSTIYDSTLSNSTKTDSNKTNSTKSESTESHSTESDSTESHSTESELTESHSTESDSSETHSTESDSTETHLTEFDSDENENDVKPKSKPKRRKRNVINIILNQGK